MKIKRDGVEIELTRNELYLAYEEQQHLFDLDDIKDVFDQMGDDDLADIYGLPRPDLEVLADEMAYRMRRYMDKYDISWDSAKDEAIQDVISDHRIGATYEEF